jgi:hypothetical protein
VAPAAAPSPGDTANSEPAAPARSTARTALRLAVAALLLAVVGVVTAVAALMGGGSGSCRTTAWNAVPAVADLPAGWSVGASQVSVDGLTTRLAGPAPADATTDQPVVYAMVSCYGGDAAAGLDRSRAAAEAAGETVIDRSDLGEAGFAIESDVSGTTAVFFRRGGLVAYVAPSGTVEAADLETVVDAVEAGVERAVGGVAAAPATSGPTAGPTSTAPVASEAPTESAAAEASPSPSPSAAAPELLAILPDEVAGTVLATDSATGSDVLGTDAASRALAAALRGLDTTAADLQIAQAYDETGSLDLYLLAFRVPGVPAARLAPAILDTWLLAGSSGVTTSTVTLGGKEITVVDYGDEGAVSYVYASGEAVVVIETSDEALAGEVAALLP